MGKNYPTYQCCNPHPERTSLRDTHRPQNSAEESQQQQAGEDAAHDHHPLEGAHVLLGARPHQRGHRARPQLLHVAPAGPRLVLLRHAHSGDHQAGRDLHFGPPQLLVQNEQRV